MLSVRAWWLDPCLRTSPSSYFQGCVPRANRRPLRLSSSKSKECVRQRLPVLLLHTEPEQRTLDYGTCEKELASEKSKVVASKVDRLLASISLLAKAIVLRTYRMMCHSVRHRQLSECVHNLHRNITPTFSLSHTEIFTM